MHYRVRSVIGVSVLGLALLSLAPAASAEELPLYLTLSHSITRDSNLLRDNANKKSDTLHSTTVAAGINKAYGRQNYRLSGSASRNAYQDNKDYDNNAYSASGEFITDIAANWRVTVNGAFSEFLPSFEDQWYRFEDEWVQAGPNTERTKQGSIDVRYGLHGKLSLNSGYEYNSVDYRVTEQESKSSRSVYAGVRYLPTDLMYIGMTLSRTETEMPHRVVVGVLGEEIERDSLSVDTVWQVSGRSRVSARLASTSEKHLRDERRDFRGLTGSASWQFAPAGKLSYYANWVRDTNNAGGQTVAGSGANSLYSSNKRLTNQYALGANWQATAKVKLNASYTYATFEEDESVNYFGVISDDRQGRGKYNAWNVGVNYQPIQAVGVGCDVQVYDRTASVFSRAYDGETFTCRASFTLD